MKKRIAKKKGLISVFSAVRNANALLYGPPPISAHAAARLKDKIESARADDTEKKDTEKEDNK